MRRARVLLVLLLGVTLAGCVTRATYRRDVEETMSRLDAVQAEVEQNERKIFDLERANEVQIASLREANEQQIARMQSAIESSRIRAGIHVPQPGNRPAPGRAAVDASSCRRQFPPKPE